MLIPPFFFFPCLTPAFLIEVIGIEGVTTITGALIVDSVISLILAINPTDWVYSEVFFFFFLIAFGFFLFLFRSSIQHLVVVAIEAPRSTQSYK